MDDGDLVRDRQPARDEVLLDDGDQRRQVEGDLAIADPDGAVAGGPARQHRDERLASPPAQNLTNVYVSRYYAMYDNASVGLK